MNVQQELIIAHQGQQHAQIMLEVLVVLVKLVILEMVSLVLVNHFFFFLCTLDIIRANDENSKQQI